MISVAAYHVGKFLREEELAAASQACSWCEFSGNRAVVLPLQENPSVVLLRCPRCHAVSVSRLATQAAINAYYASYYKANSASRVTCGNPERFARHICRFVDRAGNASKIRLLDFGGGDGSISHALALLLAKRSPAQIEIVVVDYNRDLVPSTHPQVTLSHAAGLEEIPSGESFDLIMASAILEHLPEPLSVTKGLLRLMGPGSSLYIRTPYMAPLLQVLHRMRIPYDFTFPAHFHDLGEDFWSNILSTLKLPAEQWALVESRPSLVETGLSQSPVRTLTAYLMKAPWWVLRRVYPYVGGWEIVMQRKRTPGRS